MARGYSFASYTLDLTRGCLREGDREIKLRPQTFTILAYFIQNAGRLLSKDELLKAAWAGVTVTEDSLVQCVKEIRRAICDSSLTRIKTVPGRGYLFDLPVSTSESGMPINIDMAVPRRSIVVLPFVNLTGDSDQEYFADGLTENLTTDLSTHISDLFVISRSSAFTYKSKSVNVVQIADDLGVRHLLEGSVQRSGSRIRVNARLLNGESGAHVWAGRFDSERTELFDLQDEITGRIANSLEAELTSAIARDSEWQVSPEAADLAMRARAIRMQPESLGSLHGAEILFRRALDKDKRQVDALVGLGHVISSLVVNFAVRHRDLDEAEKSVADALAIAPQRASAHFVRGVILRARRQNREAAAEYETAISFDRNHAVAHANLGAQMSRLGQPEKAISLIEWAMRLSPRDPLTAIFQWQLGCAHMYLRHDDVATDWFLKTHRSNPDYWFVFRDLAAMYGLKGDKEQARVNLARLLQAQPGYSISELRRRRESDDPEYLRLREGSLVAGLRMAGLPEE